MAKKSSRKQPTFTLHYLLGALSFWGTATRTLLFGFIAALVFIIALSETTTPQSTDQQILYFISVLASFVVLDFGYVMIARAYAAVKKLDVLVLLLADLFLASLYVVPRLVVDPSIVTANDPILYVFFMPIVVLSARILLGMLFSGRR